MSRSVEARMFETQITDRGEYSSSCGYCHSPGKNSNSHGLWTEHMSVEHYQGLLNRGWRRSGKYVYKPNSFESCCPLYTIRLPVAAFEMSKEQRRVQRRFQRFLDGNLDRELSASQHRQAESRVTSHQSAATASTSDRKEEAVVSEIIRPETYLKEKLKAVIQSALTICLDSSGLSIGPSSLPVSVKEISKKVKGHLQQQSTRDQPVFSSNIAFLVASTAAKRARGGDSAQKSSGNVSDNVYHSGQHNRTPTPLSGTIESAPITARAVAESMAESMRRDENLPSHVCVSALNGHLNFHSSQQVSVTASRMAPAQKTPSGIIIGFITGAGVDARETSSQSNKRGGQRGTEAEANSGERREGLGSGKDKVSKKREFTFSMARSSFLREEFDLYKKYQMKVHGDTAASLTTSSYKRFLVDSPLHPVPPSQDGTTPSCGYGSFHQQYRIDGRLVMVGVVDILPLCLSSKYLIWDPDFSFLSLGKLSAVKEIEWVREEGRECASLEYYFLGFYCHTCPKLKYKAAYAPSDLLCPLRLRWVSYSQAVPLLDKNPAAILTTPSTEIENKSADSTLKEEKAVFDPKVTLDQKRAKEWILDFANRRGEGGKNREEEEELQAMVEQADVEMTEAGGAGGAGEGGKGGEAGVDSRRDEGCGEVWCDVVRGVDMHAESDGMRRLTEEEQEGREMEAEVGVHSVPLFINGTSLPFEILKTRKLLRELDLAHLKQELLYYLHLVGNDLGSKMAYKL